MGSILQNGKTQFIDGNGFPLVGGTVGFYQPGTENPLTTWQDSALSTPNINPVVLDARGQAIIWGNTTYRQIVQDRNGITIWDQIVSAAASAAALAGTGGAGLIGMPDGTTLASQFSLNLNHVVDSIGALRATSHVFYGRAFVTGYYKASDGGGGAYQYDANDTSSADNGSTIIVAADGARWKLQQTGIITLEQGGAKADRTTDDSTNIQNLLNAVSAAGGGTVEVTKAYYVASAITVANNVKLIGSRGNPGVERSAGVSYDNTNSLLLLGASATISMGDSTSIEGVTILTSSLKGQLPFASSGAAAAGVGGFAGIGITVAGDDVDIRNCLILGFWTGIYGIGRQRITIDNAKIDCTNGIDIENAADVCKVLRCHCWPFLTGYLAFAGGTALVTRSGFAYQFKNVADWSEHIMCSSYGFFNGFIYDSVNAVQNIGGAADYPVGMAVNGSGFVAVNTTSNLNLIAPRAEGQSYGVFVNTSNGSSVTGTAVSVLNGKFWSNQIAGVRVQTGRAIVQGNEFYNIVASGAQGVSLGPSATQNGPCVVANNDFDACTTPVGVDADGVGVHSIFGSTQRNCADSFGAQQVYDNSSAQRLSYSYSSGNGVSDRMRKARGTAAAPTIVAVNDTAGTWEMDAYDGAAFRSAGMIRCGIGATIAPNVVPGRLIFSTNLGSTAVTDVAIIDETGALRPVTDNAYTLGNSTNRWSTVYAATGTINTSDGNTKTDIADAALGLDFINALQPKSYKFIVGGVEVVRQVFRDADGNECESDAEDAQPAEIITKDRPGVRTHWGLIAQEVKTVVDAAGVDFAGWTIENKDDPNSLQGLRYDQFIAPLIKAVQQLTARVAQLESKA